MGFFQHSFKTAPTDTIPASTTLSARIRSSYRIPILAVGALTSAGVLYMAVAPGHPSSAHKAVPRTDSNVQLNIDKQTTASGADVPTASPPEGTAAQPHVSTSLHAAVSGTNPPQVTVNGQNIEVPENGSVNKTITDASGQTSLDIHASSNGTASNDTSTSLNISVNSSTNSFDDNSP